jgi:hypothetical protein
MSDAAPVPEETLAARLRRMNAETDARIVAQRSLDADMQRFMAEQMKLLMDPSRRERDDRLQLFVAVGGVVVGILGALTGLAAIVLIH